MGNYQTGYGHSDVVGVPFDLYSGATQVATGTTYNMQTGGLILVPAAAVTGIVVNLPLNPVDGAEAFISNLGATASNVTLTVNANTGDVILGGGLGPVTSIVSPAAVPAAGSALVTVKYKYSLFGAALANGTFVNARTWFRVQ
jgi:hypothetical protein